MEPKTILAFGYHDQEAPRHWNVRKALQEEGWYMIECHTKEQGLMGKYLDLWRQFRSHRKGAGAVLVTFPGHYLMPLAWLLTRLPRKRLIFDAFISLHDTLVGDRKKVGRWNPTACFLSVMDWLSCHLADEVLIDTEAQREFFMKRIHCKPDRIRVIYLGTREDLFTPVAHAPRNPNQPFNVLFYGTYIPLQGIEYIIDAASILQKTHPKIHFTLVGSGQTFAEVHALAEHYDLTNITFRARVPYGELPGVIRSADLCLGIFGTSDKARRVIPHKVFDAVACGVPVLTADTPAIREKFENDPRVILCKAGDPQDIARNIAMLCP